MAAFYIFFGGGLGSLCRYGVGLLFPTSLNHIGTLLANAIACLLLGIFVGLGTDDVIKDQHKLLLITGFCGGFSTFSTFSHELINLHNTQNLSMAALHMTLSIVLGVCCVMAGIWISSHVGIK